MGAPPKRLYRPSPTKRRRRTKAEIEAICEAMYAIVEADRPCTVRQVFYRAVASGIVEKTEAEYRNTVGRLLLQMRRDYRMPYSWISDNTRWVRRPRTFRSMEEALRRTAETYRRSLWDSQPTRVEIWSEKDAIAGVLSEETFPFDVPLMVVRGFPSDTYLWSIAQEQKAARKPVHIYLFGDWDPSGVSIERSTVRKLRKLGPGTDLVFQRAAVYPGQVEEYGLQTRPTKKSDSRAKNFKGGSVEVDAIAPPLLRALVRKCIEQHIDPEELDFVQAAEESERSVLLDLVEEVAGG